MLPSVKTLAAVFRDKAKQARSILELSRAELEQLPVCDARIRECYLAPSTLDLRMTALNELAETSGVEAFQLYDGTHCDYLNAGDTYAATIVHYHGKYRVSTWGDIAERLGGQD